MSVLSYKPEVQVGSDLKWYDNALRFATRQKALWSAYSLLSRWTAVTDYRATATKDAVNYKHVEGKDVRIEPEHDLQVNAILDNKGKLTP